ncbi:MAG: hypothetical protein AM325_012085 [Candidatus Thorarchaeota archaeon SMTZ1-45]|nr:MAG: hypothetical protein AM325_13770 [Candidatus Thorarchaeota archaeon SMTZ1-45]
MKRVEKDMNIPKPDTTEIEEEKPKVKLEKPPKIRKVKTVTWEAVTQKVYDRIEWYATRFIIMSTVGVVIGFIALVYGGIAYVFTPATLQDASVFLAVFVGVGAVVASLILLAWGLFWRKKVEMRNIF